MRSLHPVLESLYENPPKLLPHYIAENLKLSGEAAERLMTMSGGIDRAEAEMLCSLVEKESPRRTLEVGLGYGYSAIAILAASAAECSHIAIDPFQSLYWRDQALRNIERAGFATRFELIAEPSHRALSELEGRGSIFDLAFIDGCHHFDYVFVDFFYVDKLIKPGGLAIFDDADWPSIRPVLRFAVTNLGYSALPGLRERKERPVLDVQLGLEGSCIALRKPMEPKQRDLYFHKGF